MTPAELDTRRRMLGLSIAEVAALCGNVQERVASRWFAGTYAIPAHAIDAIEDLEDIMNAMVAQLVATVTSRSMAGPVPMLRYRTADELSASVEGDQIPFGAHAIYVGWAADALADEGVEVEIRWADEVK